MLVRKFIVWMVRRTPWHGSYMITAWDTDKGKKLLVARRYEPFWADEIQRGDKSIYRQLPWWRPFNILLHHWRRHDDKGNMHDHPRWSISIPLKGELIEKSPWGERLLKPGRLIFRSPRSIHGFRVAPEHGRKTWTLFIVGRRKYAQNSYSVTRQTEASI